MKHIAKKNWTESELEMIERLGYTGKTATSAVALSREEKESYKTELADVRRDQKRGILSLGSLDDRRKPRKYRHDTH